MVKPRPALSQSEPQYVIFSEALGDRRQSYGDHSADRCECA